MRREDIILQAHQNEWFARQKRLKSDPSHYFQAKPKPGGREVVSRMIQWQKAGLDIKVKRIDPEGKKGQD